MDRPCAKTCKAAIDAHQRWLETVLVPAAKGDFRLGAELYDAKLMPSVAAAHTTANTVIARRVP